MKFQIYSYRYALEIIQGNESLKNEWDSYKKILESITGKDLMDSFLMSERKSKSISQTLYKVVTKKLKEHGWVNEVNLYNDDFYRDVKRFTLDFYKNSLAMEFSFGHEATSSWKLIKSVLAAQENTLSKNIQSKVTILLAVTSKMKSAGGFDGSIATYEKFIQYVEPMKDILVEPIIIIGLEPVDEFRMQHKRLADKKIGVINKLRK
jgi:hypothetical protein